MPLRYLYADSEPFPHSYDLLATLKGFLAAGSECLSVVAELERSRAAFEEARAASEREARAIELYVQSIDDQIDLAVGRNPQRSVVEPLANDLHEHMRRAAEGAKAQRESTLRQEETRMAGEAERVQERLRAALSKWFLGDELDVLSSRVHVELVGERYEARSVFSYPAGVEVSFQLAAGESDAWSRPRRVGELLEGFQIQIGLKKRFLSRDFTRELMRLEDHVVRAVDLETDRLVLRVRRKPEGPDQLTLDLTKRNGMLHATIQREKDGEATFPAVDEDLPKLQELWDALEAACRPALVRRERVLSASLDAADLFDAARVTDFIDRYVELFAPVVSEIARRSPSRKELSLKLEHPDGRREELYLRKDELAELMGALSDHTMQVFAPLEIFPEIDVEMD